MNSMEMIRKQLEAQPFKPFSIFISDGAEIKINHPETVAFSPNRKSVFAYSDDENFEFINPIHITRVEGSVGVSAAD